MRGRQRFRPLHLDVQNPQLLAPSEEDHYLMPAYLPPKSHIYDIFPFSLIVRLLTNGGKEMKGKKAARLRARMQDKAISHNLPLEISLYLVGFSREPGLKNLTITPLKELIHLVSTTEKSD